MANYMVLSLPSTDISAGTNLLPADYSSANNDGENQIIEVMIAASAPGVLSAIINDSDKYGFNISTANQACVLRFPLTGPSRQSPIGYTTLNFQYSADATLQMQIIAYDAR